MLTALICQLPPHGHEYASTFTFLYPHPMQQKSFSPGKQTGVDVSGPSPSSFTAHSLLL